MKKEPLDALNIPLHGINLIEAAAGTGKTYTITTLALRILLEQSISIREMAVISFTNAAAEELSTRLRTIISSCIDLLSGRQRDPQAEELVNHDRQRFPERSDEERLRKLQMAIRDFDLAPISTINGFYQRVLSDYAFESGVLFNSELNTNPDEKLHQIFHNWLRKKFYADNWQDIFYAIFNKKNDFVKMAIRYASDRYLALPEEQGDLAKSVELIEKNSAKIFATADPAMLEALSEKLKNSPAKKMPAFIKLLAEKNISYNFMQICSWYTPEIILKNSRSNDKSSVEKTINSTPFFNYCASVSELFNNLSYFLHRDALISMRRDFEKLKEQDNFMTYDDQITRVDTAMEKSTGNNSGLAGFLRSKFKIGIIDEFQDTNPAQYRIFLRLFGSAEQSENRCCFMVGDPRQAIYRFRGGDLAVYFEARNSAGKIFYMDRNFRSSSSMVAAVNEVFAKHDSPFMDDRLDFPMLKSRPPSEAPGLKNDNCPLQRFFIDPEPAKALPDYCAARISALLAPDCSYQIPFRQDPQEPWQYRKITPADIAVLVWSHSEAYEIRNNLLKLNIPAVCARTGSIYNSPEANDLYQLLSALLYPETHTALNTALATDFCGADLIELANDCETRQTMTCMLQTAADKWRKNGFADMFEYLMESFAVRPRFAAMPDGERKLSNLLQLEEILQQNASSNSIPPETLVREFGIAITNASNDDPEQAELLSTERSAVRLMTIHASKGMQFPIVILPGLQKFKWDNRAGYYCHDRNNTHIINLKNSEELKQNAISEERQEQLRLLYVAITRAQFRCEIFTSHQKAHFSALDYLLFRNVFNNDGAMSFPDPAEFASSAAQSPDSDSNLRIPSVKYLHRCQPYMPPARQDNSSLIKPPLLPPVMQDWKMVSYSLLSRDVQATGQEPPPLDHDESLGESNLEQHGVTSETQRFTPFLLPGGGNFGTAVHAIFENVDFNGSPEHFSQLTGKVFRQYGICRQESADERDYLIRHSAQWLRQICHEPLTDFNNDRFVLAEIMQQNRKNEMEFYFPLGSFSLSDIREAVDSYVRSDELKLAAWPEKWEDKLAGGILNGFIDLVFRRNGQYYIIDWKTNRLGNDPENFAPEMLKLEMVHSFYFFQYLIYIVALVQYLRRYHPNFGAAEYENLFGGVYYLFVRGIDPDRPGNGIFRARPPWSTIEQLEMKLCK